MPGLRNEFSRETKDLWFWRRYCSRCARGDRGLELDHIVGRSENSAYAAYQNCRPCHSKKGGYDDKKRRLKYTFHYLQNNNYAPNKKDIDFLKRHIDMYDELSDDVLRLVEKFDSNE